jgi:hypothetical protein
LEGQDILNRSSLFSLSLLVAIALVGTRIYQLWQGQTWDLPKPAKIKESPVLEKPKQTAERQPLISAKNIIDKNLFDPERGATKTKEAEATSVAAQRIRSMALVGTAIIGDSRYAIMKEASDPRPPQSRPQTAASGHFRLKLGDTIDGFTLAEIEDKKVAFTNGSARVEVALDFFRKSGGLREITGAPASRSNPPSSTTRRTELPPPPTP